MKLKKLKETVDLANTSDKKLEKMSWKENKKFIKQKVFYAGLFGIVVNKALIENLKKRW